MAPSEEFLAVVHLKEMKGVVETIIKLQDCLLKDSLPRTDQKTVMDKLVSYKRQLGQIFKEMPFFMTCSAAIREMGIRFIMAPTLADQLAASDELRTSLTSRRKGGYSLWLRAMNLYESLVKDVGLFSMRKNLKLSEDTTDLFRILAEKIQELTPNSPINNSEWPPPPPTEEECRQSRIFHAQNFAEFNQALQELESLENWGELAFGSPNSLPAPAGSDLPTLLNPQKLGGLRRLKLDELCTAMYKVLRLSEPWNEASSSTMSEGSIDLLKKMQLTLDQISTASNQMIKWMSVSFKLAGFLEWTFRQIASGSTSIENSHGPVTEGMEAAKPTLESAAEAFAEHQNGIFTTITETYAAYSDPDGDHSTPDSWSIELAEPLPEVDNVFNFGLKLKDDRVAKAYQGAEVCKRLLEVANALNEFTDTLPRLINWIEDFVSAMSNANDEGGLGGKDDAEVTADGWKTMKIAFKHCKAQLVLLQGYPSCILEIAPVSDLISGRRGAVKAGKKPNKDPATLLSELRKKRSEWDTADKKAVDELNGKIASLTARWKQWDKEVKEEGARIATLVAELKDVQTERERDGKEIEEALVQLVQQVREEQKALPERQEPCTLENIQRRKDRHITCNTGHFVEVQFTGTQVCCRTTQYLDLDSD